MKRRNDEISVRIGERHLKLKSGHRARQIGRDGGSRSSLGRTGSGGNAARRIPAPSLSARGAQHQRLRGNEMTAPLPGVVTELFVKPGDQVEAGQVVLVIEAMKMKNGIRSVRAGRIGQVLVSPGQTVAHKQGLLRFEDNSGEAAWI
jgi:biotin carboxyl carrier protein